MMPNNCPFFLFSIFCFGISAASADEGSFESADIIFVNAKVYTVDFGIPWAEAVAVRGQDIVFVGQDTGAELYKGENTRVVDVAGRLMLPGIIDTHAHPLGAGANATYALDLFPHMEKTKDDILEMIRKHAEPLGPDEWVIVNGVSFPIIRSSTREELDAVTGGRPAIVRSFAHDGWYNTRALELLGIDNDTPDPEGGVIQRREDGSATGYLGEKANAVYGTKASAMAVTDDMIDASLVKMLEMANAEGLTGIFDVGGRSERDDQAYRRAHASGKLTARISLAMRHSLNKDDEENMTSLLKRRWEGDEYLRMNSIKFSIDGVPGLTAAMFEPYVDGTHPPVLYPQERMNKLFDEMSETGFRIYVHAEGDKASWSALKALEYADEHGKPLTLNDRHVLTHIDHLRLEDIPLFVELNVIANIQPHWAASNDFNVQVTFPNITEELKNTMFPNKELLEAGVHVSCGADWPTSKEWTPWEMIEIGMTRTQIGGAGGKLPGKELTLPEMIRCLTIEGAYTMFREDITGSITVGKRADLVILENDLFETPVTEIHNTEVALTLFDGKVVWGDIGSL